MSDIASTESPATAEGSVSFAPAWDWADAPGLPSLGPLSDDQVDAGRRFHLSDTQINLAGDERIWLTRWASEVTNSDGLQDAGQISFDFDPSYERVVIHHLRVIRDGHVREVDPRPGLSVLRREPDLERARFDGRLTALIPVPDVRVGDLVDFAYSNVGAPPVFAGRFAAELNLSWGTWIADTRVRILSAADRDLVERRWNDAPEAMVRPLPGGVVERVWLARDTHANRSEPDTPSWLRTNARVRVSDRMAWSEVADSFREGYALEPLPEELETEVAAAMEADAEPAARAVRLLRLVQGALRYQAISIGDGGYVPRPIAHIWATRAGDCKDASRLLTALLRGAGLDAAPALVNTSRGWGLADEPASQIAFDHCIVRLRLDGMSYWLDPTLYPQGGDLARLHQPRLGFALPLVEAAQLEPMGEDPPGETCVIDETYELGPEPNSPATLTVSTHFGRWRADDMRRTLERDRASAVRGYIDWYSRHFGAATELAPLEVQDDLTANRLTTVERYELSRPWEETLDKSQVEFSPIDTLFGEHMTTQRTAARRWPIDLGLPRRASWTTTVRLPHGVSVRVWDHVFEIDGVRAATKLVKLDEAGKLIQLDRSVLVTRRLLPPNEAEAYFQMRENALKGAGLTVNQGLRDGRFSANTAPAQPPNRLMAAWRIVWLGLVVLWIVLQVWRVIRVGG